tara:strand:+ start:1097 stop:2431 length:1335 start_codon:yes stop_codon:yes gene_type:complete
MPWQKRNMFSSAVDMQRGGSVPWPSYEGGGIIGATPKERKRMFTIWDKMTQGQKEKVMDGKRYQMGGAVMPTQLFEEGDQDINMALNNMVSMTNPSLEQIGETEMVEGEMMEDQGPASFEDALGMLKQEFYDQIGSFVTKTKDMAQIEKYLKGISVAYSNELDKLKREFDITEVHPDEELLTPAFVAEIQNMVTAPEMQLGGLVKTEADLEEYGIPFPWKVWELMSPEEKDNAMKMSLAARAGGTAGDAGVDNSAMMQRVNEIIEERKNLAKQAYAPPTKQGGILGFATQYNASKAAQAAAMDKALSDELDVIQYGQNRYGTRGTGKDSKWTAALQEGIFDQEEAILDPEKIYKQAVDAAGKGMANDPSTYVPVHLAQGGHQDLVESVDASLAAIKNLDGRPINFSDFVNMKRMEAINAGQEWDPLSNSRIIVAEFLNLPNDEG